MPFAAAQSVCKSHPHISVADSHFVPLGLPVQMAHVPEPPHAVGWFPVTQEPIEQQVPPPHVPLPAAPQVAVHDVATHVGVAAAHVEQSCPLPPQAPFWVPAVQLPALLQQPPLHPVSLVPRHALPHVWVPVLHACPAAHPAAVSHPQVSVPGSQFGPFALPMQVTHARPFPPHAPLPVPAAHVPPVPQQPPLHG